MEEDYPDQKQPVINITLPLLTLKSIFDLVAWTETWVYFTFSSVPKTPIERNDDDNEMVEEEDEGERECILIATQPNGRSGMAVSELVVNEKSFKEIELWNTVETGVYIAMRSILDNAQPGSFVNMIIYNRGRDTPVESIQTTMLTKDGNVSTLVFSVPTIIDNKERELGPCEVYLVAHSTVKKFGTALTTQNKMISSSLSQEEKKSMNSEYGPSLKVNLVFRQLENLPEDHPSNEITRVIDFEYYSYEGHVNMCVQRLFTMGSSNNTFDKVESNFGDSFKIMFRIQLMLHSIGQLKKYPSFEKLTFQCRFIKAPGKDYDEPNVIVIESISVDKSTGDVLANFNGIFNLDAFPMNQNGGGADDDDDDQPFLNVSEYTGMEIHSKVIDGDSITSQQRNTDNTVNSYETMCKKLSAAVAFVEPTKKPSKKSKSTKFTSLALESSLSNVTLTGSEDKIHKTAKKESRTSGKNNIKYDEQDVLTYEEYMSHNTGQNIGDYYDERDAPGNDNYNDDNVDVDDDDDDPFADIGSSPSSQSLPKPKRRSRNTSKVKKSDDRTRKFCAKQKSKDSSTSNIGKSRKVKKEHKTLGKRSRTDEVIMDANLKGLSQDALKYSIKDSTYYPPLVKKKSKLTRDKEISPQKERKSESRKLPLRWADGSDEEDDDYNHSGGVYGGNYSEGITRDLSFGDYNSDNEFE